jgi:hypothetical protein
MIIINIFSYPIQSEEECIKCFMELPPFPDYITEKGLYTRFAIEGIEGIHILEVDDSKLSEAKTFIGKRIMAFSKVPSFKCSSQMYYTLEEGMKMLE